MQVFPSAARTASANGDFVLPRGYKGVLLRLNISVFTGTSLDIKLQAYDDAAQAYFDLKDAEGSAGGINPQLPTVIAFPQKTGTGSDDLISYPSSIVFLPAATSKRFNSPLPRKLRAVATFVGTTATYSLAAIPL